MSHYARSWTRNRESAQSKWNPESIQQLETAEGCPSVKMDIESWPRKKLSVYSRRILDSIEQLKTDER